MQEAASCQNKLHGLQAHSVALGWQVHGRGAHAHSDAVSLLQLQCAVQQRGQLCQAIAARTVSLLRLVTSGDLRALTVRCFCSCGREGHIRQNFHCFPCINSIWQHAPHI